MLYYDLQCLAVDGFAVVLQNDYFFVLVDERSDIRRQRPVHAQYIWGQVWCI